MSLFKKKGGNEKPSSKDTEFEVFKECVEKINREFRTSLNPIDYYNFLGSSENIDPIYLRDKTDNSYYKIWHIRYNSVDICRVGYSTFEGDLEDFRGERTNLYDSIDFFTDDRSFEIIGKEDYEGAIKFLWQRVNDKFAELPIGSIWSSKTGQLNDRQVLCVKRKYVDGEGEDATAYVCFAHSPLLSREAKCSVADMKACNFFRVYKPGIGVEISSGSPGFEGLENFLKNYDIDSIYA